MRTFKNRERRGAAMIEFAFWLPVVVVLTSALIDFSWYMANAQNIMQAARDGARRGASSYDDPATGANEVVQGARDGANWIHSATPLTCSQVNVNQFTKHGLDALTVNVTCAYTPLVGAFPLLGIGFLGGTAPILPSNISYSFTMFEEIQ